ncbi:MAG TPA: hypothetical protein VK745_18320 [Polyangiaceae bacterium]|jgi:hypothetical protein|nr:hypothetical protein [Polyangiaceae bacterium]
MRWYVSREGEVVGPIEPAELMEWVRTRPAEARVGLCVRDDAGSAWSPIEQSPFAQALPVAASAPAALPAGGDALGYVILSAPFFSGVLVWLWVGNMNLLQDPEGTLFTLVAVTVLGTAVLMAVEASQLGMGTENDSRGKKGTGPIAWFLAACVMWLVAFPWYLDQRRYYGRKPLAIGGILVMLFFLGSSFAIGAAIENKKAEVRARFSQAEASFSNFSVPTPAAAPAVDHGAELARFTSAKRKLKVNPPKTEADLVEELGEPSSTTNTPGSKMLMWYYETKDIGRDVIVASVNGGGKVALVQY